MVESSEQRDFRRMSIDCPMVFRLLNSDQVWQATAKNISSTGMLFTCEHSLNAGDRLVVNVTPEKTIVPPLNAVVEVLRVEPSDEGKQLVACTIEKFLA